MRRINITQVEIIEIEIEIVDGRRSEYFIAVGCSIKIHHLKIVLKKQFISCLIIVFKLYAFILDKIH